MAEALLELREITKSFPGVCANDHVSFDLRAGEVHALVGENGAGKTTLMKILYGLHRPDSGLDRRPGDAGDLHPRAAGRHPPRASAWFTSTSCCSRPFTVLENIILGEESHTAGVLATERQRRQSPALMEENRLVVDLVARVEDLSVGIQQSVEILKILFRGATHPHLRRAHRRAHARRNRTELFRTFRALKAHGRGSSSSRTSWTRFWRSRTASP